jgi:hypothetical protein
MNKKTWILSAGLISASVCMAQDFNFDKPSFYTILNHVVEADIDGSTTDLSLSELSLSAPLYKFDVGNWSAGFGISYEYTDLDFSDKGLLDESDLHSIDLPFFITMKSSDTLRWLLMGKPNLSGDYDDVDSDTMNYSLLGGARYKRSETFEWLFGFFYTTGFEDELFVPAIGFMWDITDRSRLLFAGPIVQYNYKISDKVNWSIDGKFAGNRWDTQADYVGSADDREFRLRSYRISTNVEMNLTDKQKLFAGIGWDIARELEIKNGAGVTLIEEDIDEALVFELGYRLSF